MSNWIGPRYTPDEINRAGDPIPPRNISREPIQYQVILNWRAERWFPLNTIAVSLKKHTLKIDPDATVATRVKRFWSIRNKLQRMRRLIL